MFLQREHGPSICNPATSDLVWQLRLLNGSGASSFAMLMDETGNCIRVLGGGVKCMMERYDANSGRWFRAWQREPVLPFDDGELFHYSGGRIPLLAGEWFLVAQVIDVFRAYLRGVPFPDYVLWREVGREDH